MRALFSTAAVTVLAALATQAHAADAAAATMIEEVIVTGASVARGNTIVGAQQIETQSAAQNVIDAIKPVAGVSIRGADAYNADPWSYGISIRGFDVNLRSSKIGQTIDDMPAYNASYYLGGAPAQKYLQSENVSQIQVNQGTAGLSSASSSALGGTLAFYTRDPAREAGGQVALTVGDNELRRYAAVYDFGQVGPVRGYVGAARLTACRWAYGCSDQSVIDETHFEGKFVAEFGEDLTITGFASYDDALDDPIIEDTRANLDNTNRPDGSVPSFLPARVHDGDDPNQYWAHGWGAKRENTFTYLKLAWRPSAALSLEFAPYLHHQSGMGYFVPPYQQIAVDQTAPGAFVRTQAGGAAAGSSRYRAYYGVLLNGRQRAVIPGLTYTDTDGTVVASSRCYAAGTAYASNGKASYAGLNNTGCVPLQTFRTSLYGHDRYGFTAKADYELGAHQIEGGVWYERLDRDFGRAWRQIIDVTTGSATYYTNPQLIDFQQHFTTDQWKFFLQDKITLGDLTLSGGVQMFLIDIEGVKDAWDAHGAPATGLKTSLNADSDLLFSLGAVYRVSDQLEAFGTFSQNYGAVGDWALEKTGTDTDNLNSSVASNVDVGLRYRNGPLMASATAYYVRYKNAITFRTADYVDVSQGGGINYAAGTSGSYINAGDGVESYGLEASALYDVTPELGLYGALTLNSSTYLADFVGGTANAGADRQVRKGNEVPAAPKTIVNLGVDYHRGPFAASLSANYQGKTAGDAMNTPALYLPARTLVDLSASYELPALEGVSLQLNVSNLLDEDYIGGSLDEFTQRYMRGAPRTVSATLRAKF